MRKLVLVLLIALVAMPFVSVSRSFAQSKVVRITLIDENGSGEDGSAQITDQGDGTTKVELIMTNQPEGSEQPAAIHEGTCTSLDADVAFALTPVKDLKSTSTIKTALATLLNSKYAVAVTKSATDKTVISCGILPSAAVASGGAMTMAQVMSTLLDQANELQGTIKKKEADASQNAYKTFHATFAAHEDDIKKASPPDQEEVDTAMTAVNTALGAGDWDKSAAAAAELVKKVTEAQEALSSMTSAASSTVPAGVPAYMDTLKSTAADLQRETKNADKEGSQAAYTAFHDAFAANENDLKAKNAEAQAHIEDAMHEVRDALAAGDLAKASTAATEVVNEVNDAIGEMSAATSSGALPNGGVATSPVLALVLVVASLLLVFAGTALRRRITS